MEPNPAYICLRGRCRQFHSDRFKPFIAAKLVRTAASETATSLFYKNAPTAGIRPGNCFSDYIRNRFQYVSAPFPANKNLFETVVPERSEAKKGVEPLPLITTRF